MCAYKSPTQKSVNSQKNKIAICKFCPAFNSIIFDESWQVTDSSFLDWKMSNPNVAEWVKWNGASNCKLDANHADRSSSENKGKIAEKSIEPPREGIWARLFLLKSTIHHRLKGRKNRTQSQREEGWVAPVLPVRLIQMFGVSSTNVIAHFLESKNCHESPKLKSHK